VSVTVFAFNALYSNAILRSDQLGPNQVCTLFGATPGSSVVSGSRYLEVGFQLNVKNIWRMELVVRRIVFTIIHYFADMVLRAQVLIGIFVVFQILQIIALEYFKVCCSE
jgi:ATP-binding cassette subfamily G (WHITE) protein 2 (SNQ2)